MTPSKPETSTPGAELSSGMVAKESQISDDALADAWLTIRKRKFVILGLAALGCAYGLYKGLTQPRLYVAGGTIQLRSGAANEYRINGSSIGGELNSKMPTEVAILKSETLLLAVAKDLNLANNKDFLGAKGPVPFRNIDDLQVRQDTINGLSGALTVAAIGKTSLIRISASTLDPKLSADIVNKLINEYIYRSLKVSRDSFNRVDNFLKNDLDQLRQQVEEKQKQMIDLQKDLGDFGYDPQKNQIINNIDDLTKSASAAELRRIQAEVHYRILSGLDKNSLDESVDALNSSGSTTQLGALRGQLENLKTQLSAATAAGNLLEKNPKVTSLQDQINQVNHDIAIEQARVLGQAKANVDAAVADEARVRDALAAAKTDAFSLRDKLVQYTIAQREFESQRTIYESLMQRLSTAGIEAGLESTEVYPVDEAAPPISPSLQSKSTMMIVDGTLGLVVGLIIAFLLDSLDAGLSSVAELEAVSGLPSLALIPRTRRGTEPAGLSTTLRNLKVLSSPKSQFAEAFRALRTSLLLSRAGKEPQVLLLTSATPSEGKTTVSINLACVLAQRDVRVLLIDADLRRPTVHHRFGLNGKVGLTSILTGALSLDEAIQTIPDVPTLDVLVSGPVPPFPTEMLGSESMRELLRRCRDKYTHIVMDSPPLLSVTDSVVLANQSDAVVLIVRHGKSGKHAVRRARDLLVRAGAPIAGIALNAVDLTSPEYYSYYGYYGYAGYGSAGVDSAGWESQSGAGNGPSNGAAKRKGDGR